MILQCPECSTRFALDARKLGESGRKVKCGRCGHVWFQDRPADAAVAPAYADRAYADQAAAAAATAPAMAAEPGADAGPAVTGRRPFVPERSGLPSTQIRPRRGRVAAGWAALILLVAAVITIGAAARDEIVALWPPALKLYETIGLEVETAALPTDAAIGTGLAFGRLVTEITGSGPERRLIVRGEVMNTSDVERDVPPLQVTLTDGAGSAVGGWTFEVERRRLAPGESAPFAATADDWPAQATGVEVTVAQPDSG
jgi:predicted Zn finger-like uncharacterized protein